MPGQNRTAAYPRQRGWWFDGINNRLVAVFNGTEIFDFDGNDLVFAQAMTLNAPTGALNFCLISKRMTM